MSDHAASAESQRGALDAIHDEASRLLLLLPSDAKELRDGLGLIISLARYKFDVRSEAEIKNARVEGGQ
jgi:hypothetical protein